MYIKYRKDKLSNQLLQKQVKKLNLHIIYKENGR